MSGTAVSDPATLDAALLHLLFAGTDEAMLAAAADGCVLRANAALERLLGGPIVARRHLRDVLGVSGWAGIAAARAAGRGTFALTGDDLHIVGTAMHVPGWDGAWLLRLTRPTAEPASGLRDLGAVHDLNNVFAMILGAAEAAEAGETTALTGLAAMARRGGAMVRAVLDGRTADGAVAESAVDPAIAALRPALAHVCGPAVSLRVEAGAPGMRIGMDAPTFERVLLNLVANARDALDGRGHVTVRTLPSPGRASGRSDGVHVLVEVCDDGPGMPPEIADRVGEPFFTTKAAGKGTGLGLATVRDLLAQVHGWLTIDSSVGAGTRVGVHLPATRPAMTPPLVEIGSCVHPCPIPSDEGRGDVRLAQPRGTVLLVEDEAMLRGLAARALAIAGWHVRQAASGEAALALLEAGAISPLPALLVTDLALPGIGGRDLVLAVRAQQGLAHLPVIVASGFAGISTPAPAAGEPCMAVLAKPFEMRELTAAAESLTAAPARLPVPGAAAIREKRGL